MRKKRKIILKNNMNSLILHYNNQIVSFGKRHLTFVTYRHNIDLSNELSVFVTSQSGTHSKFYEHLQYKCQFKPSYSNHYLSTFRH